MKKSRGNKPPYVDWHLIEKIQKIRETGAKASISTKSRRSVIIPDFVGHNIKIHNGKAYVDVFIVENMVGHKLGEFAPTRVFKGHSGNKKAEQLKKGGKK